MKCGCYFKSESIWIFFFIISIFSINVNCEPVKVTLLDTQDFKELTWTTYPQAEDRGWKIYTLNTGSGDVIPLYGSCDVDIAHANNWLRTPYIQKGKAKRMYVEIHFLMRECDKEPKDDAKKEDNYLFCKETINLLYYEADANLANDTYPAWTDVNSYTPLDSVASEKQYTRVPDWSTDMNVEVLHTQISRKGVYFALQDQGACVAMYKIRVYYKACPATLERFAHFEETPTGPYVVSLEEVRGVCVANAEPKPNEPPMYLCKGDGSWQLLRGSCYCKPGYQPDLLSPNHCIECPEGMYKDLRGNFACSTCPEKSQSLQRGATICDCLPNYFRATGEDASYSCTQPAGSIADLEAKPVSHSSISLKWSPPLDTGGRTDITYRVRCYVCDNENDCSTQCPFPDSVPSEATSYVLHGLEPDTLYEVHVYAENGINRAYPDRAVSKRTQQVKTLPSASSGLVDELNVDEIGISYLTVSWSPPEGIEMNLYELKWGDSRNTSKPHTTQLNSYRIDQLRPDTPYLVRVRGRSEQGAWGGWASLSVRTNRNMSDPVRTEQGGGGNSSNDAVYAGVVVAVLVTVAAVCVAVVFLCRRNRSNCTEKPVKAPESHYNHVTMPLFPATMGHVKATKTYVDPHTYEDPTQAVREFTREIDASCITIESVIGGGEFGDVCKGRLRLPNKGEKHVAIKTLKPGASDKNRLDFLTEASIMGQFNNANVIFLEGVVTRSNPIMIVTEYMENGSLDVWLRNNDGKCTQKQLLGVLKGIASGMGYLAEMGYVHRDLAARNILVDAALNCKVADFGLSREVENDTTDGAYTTKGGKIPVRWTAPEAIAYRKFTTASDVWSFGVVMWEVISYGERPYWNWSNHDVIRAVDKGYRLPPPMECPESVYQLMLDCWQKERNHRPRFTAIVKTLDKLQSSRELLCKMAKPRSISVLAESQAVPDLSRLSGVAEWLAVLKLERYTEAFLNAGITTLDEVCRLQPSDLSALGVQLVGHQKKLFTSIQTVQAQQQHWRQSQLTQAGFLV